MRPSRSGCPRHPSPRRQTCELLRRHIRRRQDRRLRHLALTAPHRGNRTSDRRAVPGDACLRLAGAAARSRARRSGGHLQRLRHALRAADGATAFCGAGSHGAAHGGRERYASRAHVIVPAVPTGLSAILLRGLMKRPEQRFADYEALATALARTRPRLNRRNARTAVSGRRDRRVPLLLISLPIGLLWGRDWYSVFRWSRHRSRRCSISA